MNLQRQLFLSHRWLGVALSVLFVVWFFSGIVMVYVGFPATDHERRIAAQPPLTDALPDDMADVILTPAARIRVFENRWYRTDGDGWYAVTDGRGLQPLDATSARMAVQAALQRWGEDARIVALEAIRNDQWTVAQRYDAHRPLWRVALDDGRWLHLSSRTGEIVLETTRAERGWNWVGSVIHWLYFTPIRERPRLWSELVIWLSTLGAVLALTGLWGGLRQFRLARIRQGRSPVPYPGVAGWHHWTGLVFGAFVVTFIVSGLLSMTPWGLFSREGVSSDERLALEGSPPPLPVAQLRDAVDAFAARDPTFVAREAETVAIDSRWWIRLRDGVDQRLIDMTTGAVVERLPDTALEVAADSLSAGRVVRDRAWLQSPDLYYYDHRNGVSLPVLRLRLADGSAPWYYLDPLTGHIALRTDATARAYRWWFNALHSLDFPWLIYFRPAWDIVVIVLSLGGLALSATGVFVGWRRLRTALSRRNGDREGFVTVKHRANRQERS